MPQEMTKKGKPKGRPTFKLETFNATIDNRSMPLSFKFLNEFPHAIPNHQRICDLESCECYLQNDDVTPIRLPCFHMFHKACFEKVNNQCPHCCNPLKTKIRNLTEAFNTSLLSSTSHISSTGANDENNTQEDTNNDDEIPDVPSHDPEYFESPQWTEFVQNVLSSFSVPQPSMYTQSNNTQSGNEHSNHSQSSNTTAATTSRPNLSSQASPIQISLVKSGNIMFWLFPRNISQSTLDGRQGSNACSFIALLLSKACFSNQSCLQLNSSGSITPSWVTMMKSCIHIGNDCHDRATGRQPINFSIQEAANHLSGKLGNAAFEEPYDLSFVSENPQVPQSSLEYFLPRLVAEPNLACLVIINGMSISFVSLQSNIFVLDSHLHGAQGALIGKCSSSEINDLLVNVKSVISPNSNICSMTFVKFN